MDVELRLTEASAVLGVTPKELQNLVQLKVIRPARRARLCRFDGRALVEAKVALYLKETLGSSSELLALFTEALGRGLGEGAERRRVVVLRSAPARGQEPVEIRIPLGSLARELKERMPKAQPRRGVGRQRAGWRAELAGALAEAGSQMGERSEDEIVAAVRAQRRRRALPEVTAVAQGRRKTT